MFSYQASGRNCLALLGCLIGSLLAPVLLAQASKPSQSPEAPKTSATPSPVHRGSPSRYRPDRFAGKATRYYRLVWGVDSLSVKTAESGELVRFSYRVLDSQKAKILNDKKTEAFLNSPEHHIQLVIPSLEKVGQLRQSNTPEAGKSYWMAFSNPHRTVKSGDRVNIVIGPFHADGLVVE
jgi:hypothetical protein